MSASTEDKRVRWDWDYLQSIAETENLYLLTDRDIQALITPLAVMSWRTRVLNAPSDFDLVNTFNATLLERLLTPMDFCALMIDCIENNESVQQALIQIIINQGLPINKGGQNPFGTGTGEGNIFNGLPCDAANLYGYCVAIVDYIEAVARDFIETVVGSISDSTRIARAIDLIPIIGDLPILDDMNDLIDWFVVNGITSFDAGYTSTMRQELICYMFEACCATCELTPYAVLQAYAVQSGLTINPTDLFWTLLGNMVGLSGDTAFAAGACAMVAGALASGSEVLGLVGLQGLTTIAASGDPDDDYLLFCDPCSAPITLVAGYGNCGNNGCGSPVNLTNIGASPVNSAWTRYTFKTSANSVSIGGYNFGAAIKDSYDRNFYVKRWGFYASPSGGAEGRKCTGGAWSSGTLSFDTNGNLNVRAIELVTNTTSPTYYIDVSLT